MIEKLPSLVEKSLERSSAAGWLLLAAVAGALIKVWPIINDQISKVREKKRSDKRDDMAEWREEMRQRMTALETDVKAARQAQAEADLRSHKVEMKLTTVTSAFSMVAGELRKLDPDNLTLKQAVDMVGLAVTEDMGMNRALNQLAIYPGVGE